ncbi:hypothetical protein TRVA0_001S08504 [Trichomonascus vanleenenianus]|uniref:uncharacterized protein n=1 Tax=Trichomonascus vanleenenianus TaxID=2268995 RepID=UPI003EC9AA1B
MTGEESKEIVQEIDDVSSRMSALIEQMSSYGTSAVASQATQTGSDLIVTPALPTTNPTWTHDFNYGEPDVPWIGIITSAEKCGYNQDDTGEIPAPLGVLKIESRGDDDVLEFLIRIEMEMLHQFVPYKVWPKALKQYLGGVFAKRLEKCGTDVDWVTAVTAVLGEDREYFCTERAKVLAMWRPMTGEPMKRAIGRFHHQSIGVPFWMMPPKFRLNIMLNALEPYFPDKVKEVRGMVQNNISMCYRILESAAPSDYVFYDPTSPLPSRPIKPSPKAAKVAKALKKAKK